MAQLRARQFKGVLATRIIAAAILVPAALFVVWAGSPWIVLLVGLVAAMMCWEWSEIIATEASPANPPISLALGLVSVLIGGFLGPLSGLAAMAAGVVVIGWREVGWPAKLWASLGMTWIIAPCVGFVWLRALPLVGLKLIVWLLVVIWTVDTCAYAFGRTFGGAKLAPRISPNKTWAGLLGGIGGAFVAGCLITAALGFHDWMLYGMASTALAVVEQLGDLIESFAKRHFGVKDSGTLIPGHGGFLDRLDGALAATSALVLVQLAGWTWP